MIEAFIFDRLSSSMLSFFCLCPVASAPITVDVPQVLAEQIIWESYATRTMAAYSDGILTLDDGNDRQSRE